MTHNNWPTVKLGNLITRAKSQTAGSKKYPVLSMTMEHGMVLQKERFKKRIAGKNTEKYKVVENGQLVVGFPIDEGVLDFQTLVQAGIVSPAYKIWELKDSSVCNLNYLRRYLRSNIAISYYRARLQGTTARRRSLTDQAFLQLPVPFPPLEEQRRIASILDESSELIEKTRVSIEQQTALQSAFTNGMVDKSEDFVNLGDLASVAGGLTLGNRKDKPASIPYLRVANVFRGRIDLSEIKELRATPQEAERTQLQMGDCLLVEAHGNREQVGRVAMWQGQRSYMSYQNHLFRIRLNNNNTYNPHVLLQILNSTFVRLQILKTTRTTSGLNTTSASKIRALKIPLFDEGQIASLSEFHKLAASNLTKTDSLLEKNLELQTSLSTRAFNGDL